MTGAALHPAVYVLLAWAFVELAGAWAYVLDEHARDRSGGIEWDHEEGV